MGYGSLPPTRMAVAYPKNLCNAGLVEGPSDVHTVWHYDIPCLGAPGASSWQSDWAELLTGFRVFVWKEPGSGGETLVNAVGQDIPGARIIIPPEGVKDPSDYHVSGGNLPELLADLKERARSFQEMQDKATSKQAQEALEKAKGLQQAPDILTKLDEVCHSVGLVGESKS